MIIWYVHKIVIEITNWIIIDDNFISFNGLIQWGFFRMTDWQLSGDYMYTVTFTKWIWKSNDIQDSRDIRASSRPKRKSSHISFPIASFNECQRIWKIISCDWRTKSDILYFLFKQVIHSRRSSVVHHHSNWIQCRISIKDLCNCHQLVDWFKPIKSELISSKSSQSWC